MRASSIAAMLLGVVGTVAQAGPVLDRIKTSKTVVMAYRAGVQPFSYVVDGRPLGYSVELCQRIVEGLRRKLALPSLAIRYEPVTAVSRIPAIVEGRADIECGSTSNTEERRQQVAFSIPHYVSGTRFLVRSDSGAEGLADFRGRNVVTTTGTSVLDMLEHANRERALGLTIAAAPDHATSMQRVGAGDAAAFAMDEVLLHGLMATSDDPARYRVVGSFLNIDPYGLMLSREDPEFHRLVDDEFRDLIYSRKAHEIYARWFEGAIPWQSGTDGGPVRRIAMKLPMNYLLRETWKVPTSQR